MPPCTNDTAEWEKGDEPDGGVMSDTNARDDEPGGVVGKVGMREAGSGKEFEVNGTRAVMEYCMSTM